MILMTAAIVSLFGLVLFAFGMHWDNPALAMIGALFIIGIGGTAMVDGVQVAAGENTTIMNQTVDGENVTVEETRTYYTDVDHHSDFPLETIVTLIGGVMFITAAGRAEKM